MREILDTIVWIVNVPATTGYAWTFIGAFSAIGLLMVASGFGSQLRLARSARANAREARARGGHPDDDVPNPLAVLGYGLGRVAAVVIVLITVAFGAVGLISTFGHTITAGYIFDHGVQVDAENINDDYVQYTAADGTVYTMEYSFFTAQSAPSDENIAFAETLVVRYLPDHPQAFVVDTEASTTHAGEPLGR